MRQLRISQQITNRDDRSLDNFLNDISRIPMISADEEAQLAQQIRDGDKQALERLVNANLRFVVSVSKQYQNQGLTLGDLINEGNLGLIKAARRFDETRGFKFISYAVWWIRQSILQAIADQARIIRLPLNRIGAISKLMQVIEKLEQKLERSPTVKEISEISEMNEEEIEMILKISGRSLLNLDTQIIESEDGYTLKDILEQQAVEGPDSSLNLEDLKSEIKIAISILNEKEKDILRYYYGLDDNPPYSLEDIAEKVGLTRERVRQIKENALKRLRKSTKSTNLKTFLG